MAKIIININIEFCELISIHFQQTSITSIIFDINCLFALEKYKLCRKYKGLLLPNTETKLYNIYVLYIKIIYFM